MQPTSTRPAKPTPGRRPPEHHRRGGSGSPGAAPPAGLEPATTGLEVRSSIQLSYEGGDRNLHRIKHRDNTGDVVILARPIRGQYAASRFLTPEVGVLGRVRRSLTYHRVGDSAWPVRCAEVPARARACARRGLATSGEPRGTPRLSARPRKPSAGRPPTGSRRTAASTPVG